MGKRLTKKHLQVQDRPAIPVPKSGIDPLIRPYVETLCEQGIETCQSCQGGKGHAYEFPTIEFWGDRSQGWRALAIAVEKNWPVVSLLRQWDLEDGEPIRPVWVLRFVDVSLL